MEDLVAQGAVLAVVGMTVVFVALVVTGLMVGQLAHFFREKPPAPAAGPIPDETIGGMDKPHLVVLAAAAAAAVQRPVRVRRVRFVSHSHVPASWKTLGRAAVHRSHNIKKPVQ